MNIQTAEYGTGGTMADGAVDYNHDKLLHKELGTEQQIMAPTGDTKADLTTLNDTENTTVLK
jgi:hypothetical protein